MQQMLALVSANRNSFCVAYPYSLVILRILSVLFARFSIFRTIKSNTTSDWLNNTFLEVVLSSHLQNLGEKDTN